MDKNVGMVLGTATKQSFLSFSMSTVDREALPWYIDTERHNLLLDSLMCTCDSITRGGSSAVASAFCSKFSGKHAHFAVGLRREQLSLWLCAWRSTVAHNTESGIAI